MLFVVHEKEKFLNWGIPATDLYQVMSVRPELGHATVTIGNVTGTLKPGTVRLIVGPKI